MVPDFMIRLHALLVNVRTEQKKVQETNTLAYLSTNCCIFVQSFSDEEKKFYNIVVIKFFFLSY
jgi:hypothetical protein